MLTAKSIPSDHPHLPRHPKTGILLVNLGTPDGTDYGSMRRYLKEFLSDRRVIEAPRILWWFILNVIILTTRPNKSGAAYERIWLKDDPDGSPLRKYTRLQAEQLAHIIEKNSTANHGAVTYAMRYGAPSIAQRLNELKEVGCNRLLIMPLYPQYAAATTATVNDEIFRWMLDQRWQPALRTIAPWHDHPKYISALAASIRSALKIKNKPKQSQHLLLSFHGIPQRYFDQGDPYHCHCMKTARLLREALGWDESRYHVAFQSRFGREPWIKPYTDETIQTLARDGVDLAVIAPGFAADCLETLEELAIEGRHQFEQNGGGVFTYIPCLNADGGGMAVIQSLVKENLKGWL
jgi:ferrochelatase